MCTEHREGEVLNFCALCQEDACIDTNGLRAIWDAWTPAHGLNGPLPDSYFGRLLAAQVVEIYDHRRSGDRAKALNEMVDIISIALNWIRYSGIETFEEAEACIVGRVRDRYEGQTVDILTRDSDRYL